MTPLAARRSPLAVRWSLFAVLLGAAPLAAQDHAAHHPSAALTDSILAPIRTMFAGMQARDSAKVRSAFVPGAIFSRPPMPGRAHRFTTLDQFLGAVGQAGPGWNERGYDAEIREDAGMATVWTFFTFHLGEEFSHCGVNAFLVVRTADGWKVSGLADSNRRTGCETAGRKPL